MRILIALAAQILFLVSCVSHHTTPPTGPAGHSTPNHTAPA